LFSSRRRHTRFSRDWSSDVCSSDLADVRRWFVVGDDYVWPRRSVSRTAEYARELGLDLSGVAYVPLGTADYSAVLRSIEESDASSEERRVGKECQWWEMENSDSTDR